MARFNYAVLLDVKQLLTYGFQAGKRQFDPAAEAGEAFNSEDAEGTKPGLHARVWELFTSQKPLELGTTTYGENGEKFAVNTRGKLETVEKHSVKIEQIVLGGAHASRGWTGGVIVIASVQLKDGSWVKRIFAVACSGVQGHIDQLVSAAIGYALAAGWALAVKATDLTLAA